MTKEELISFEKEIADRFEAAEIHAPVHLSKGNEDALIEIFKNIDEKDWVFSTWRSHYHALLHGIDPQKVRKEILDGNSITLCFPENNFYTSAIVGGISSISIGTALALKRNGSNKKVWCFVGDMAAMTGIFYESYRYAIYNDLPITFVVENNEYSTDVPTGFAWWRDENWSKVLDFNLFASSFAGFMANQSVGEFWKADKLIGYTYKKQLPHQGSGVRVIF